MLVDCELDLPAAEYAKVHPCYDNGIRRYKHQSKICCLLSWHVTCKLGLDKTNKSSNYKHFRATWDVSAADKASESQFERIPHFWLILTGLHVGTCSWGAPSPNKQGLVSTSPPQTCLE